MDDYDDNEARKALDFHSVVCCDDNNFSGVYCKLSIIRLYADIITEQCTT